MALLLSATSRKAEAQILMVGSNSSGQTTNFTSGTNTFTYAYIGATATDSNNTLNVFNTNTRLTITGGNVQVGYAGNNNSMVISNGGFVSDVTGVVSFGTGSNNAALVTGAGSTWSNSTQVRLGVSGQGSLTVANEGSVVVTGVNGIQAAVNPGSVGVLNIGSYGGNDSAGSIIAPKIAFGSGTGTLNFNQTNTFTLTNAITGGNTIVFQQLGSGTTILTGANSSANSTFISQGTLQIGDGGANGSIGSGAITNNSVLAVNSSTNITFGTGNGIRGTGVLIQIGTGTTTLNSSNTTYSGGTLISSGTLQVGAGALGALYDTNGSLGTGNVTNNAILAFARRAASDTVSNNISGTGALTVSGSSTDLTLAGSNSYSGLTTITTGNSLRVGTGGMNGTLGTGSVSNAGALSFYRSDLYTVTNAISGSGALSQIGSGTTILSGSNSYTGTTTVTNGMLQIGNGGTSGSIGGGITLSGAGILALNRADAVTLTNTIGGGGGVLSQIGSGTLVLTGVGATYGGTVISSGTLQVGDGGANGAIGTGAITNNSLLVINSSTNITFANNQAITGIGALIQRGTGTTILNATNTTYSGGTLISGGTLQVGNGATFDTNGSLGNGNVTNNATLAFSRRGASDTVSNKISGTGALTVSGSDAALTLAGSNSYSGLTTITTNNTLQIGIGGTNGTLGSGSVSNAGTLTFNRSDLYTLTNTISGSGTLSQIGSGTTILSGSNSYSGGTTVTNGMLQIGNGGTIGSVGGGALKINVSGNLAFNRSDSVTITNSLRGDGINGAGALMQIGGGTLVLTGVGATYGATVISSGTLQIGDGGAKGSIGTEAITNNSVLAINRASNITFANNQAITGTGALIQMGSGTTILNATNTTYSGGTLISGGTLQVGTGVAYDTKGSLGSGNVTNNGILAFNRNLASDTVSNNISGTGGLTFVGSSGGLTLAGSNSYSGLTTITAGNTLQIGTGSTNGTLGSGSVSNEGTLTFNRSDLYTISNAITGSGALSQIGSGTTILSGSNSYTGNTTITNGTLALNGTNSGTGLITVATNAALQGTGVAAGNVTIFAGGSLTPGSSSIGTLTVAGITFIKGGTFNILLGGSSSSLLIQSGTGTTGRGGNLTFSTNAALTSGYYTFMTNSSTGAFSSSFNGTNNLPSGYAVVYTTNTTALQQLAVLGSITTSFVGTNAIITGGSAAFTVGVSNSAFAGGQSLDFYGTSSSNTTGYFGYTTVTAQASTNVSGFSFNGTNVGAAQTGTFTINTPSPPTGSGTVTVDVYGHAVGSVNSSSIALSNAIVGYSNAITTNLIFSNAAGFNVALQTISSSTNSNLSLANVTGVATNSSSSAALTLAAGQGTGTFSNNVTVVYGDSSSLSGAKTNLSTNTVAVTGAIYDHARGSLTNSTINLGNLHSDYSSASASVNAANASGYRVNLAGSTVDSNGISFNALSGVVAGSSSAVTATLASGKTAGAISQDFTYTFADDSSFSGASANVGSTTITVAGGVFNYAAGTFATTNINLGNIHAGSSFVAQNLSLSNSATGPVGYVETLGAVFTNASGVSTSGSVSSLTNGSSSSALEVTISDNTAGAKSGSVGVALTSESIASGLSNSSLGSSSITVSGFVYTGQGVWNHGSGSWSTFDNWQQAGGTPGLDGALSANDTATFGSGGSGTVRLDGFSPSISSLTFSNASSSYAINTGSGSGSLTLTAGSSAAAISNAAGTHSINAPLNLGSEVTLQNESGTTLTLAGVVSGTGGLTQAGAGTITITGENTYSGGTTISAGTLLANNTAGSALGSSSVTVQSGGTLSGNGSIFGSTTIASGGTLAPGSGGTGALGFRNDLTLLEGSTTTFLINSTNLFSSIKLIGSTVTYGGNLVFNITSYTPAAGDAFKLFNMTGGAVAMNDFSSVTAGSLIFSGASGIWTVSSGGLTYQFTDSTGQLTVTDAVPEPSTYALFVLGALALIIASHVRSRRVAR